MSLLDSLPHLATAKRRTRTKSTLGGSKDSYPTTLFTDLACWQQPAGDSEITEAQRRGITITNKIYFNADPGVDERDVLEIGGQVYKVVSFGEPDASVGLGLLWRVMVNRTSTEAL